MTPSGFARLQPLLNEYRPRIVLVHALGVIQAVLILFLLLTTGLLASLLIHRGITRLTPVQIAEGHIASHFAFPERLSLPDQRNGNFDVEFPDTGMIPDVVRSLSSPNPLTRLWGRFLHWAMDLRLPGMRVNPLQTNQGALQVLLAKALGLIVLIALVHQLRDAQASIVVADLVATLRGQVHRHVFRLGQTLMPGETDSQLLDLFTRSMDDIRDGLMTLFTRGISSIALIVVLTLLALAISPLWALLTFIIIAAAWLIARPVRRVLDRDAEIATRNAAISLRLMREDIELVRTARVYGMEEQARMRFERHLDRHEQAETQRLLADSRRRPLAWILWAVVAAVGLGLFGHQILKGPDGSIGLVSSAMVVALILLLANPLRGIFRAQKGRRRATRGAATVFSFLDRPPELLQSVKAVFLAPVQDRISFENVSLDSYSGRPLLVGATGEIPAKLRTAILGVDEPSKHALVALIPRLIDPQIGRVRIDGHDLRDVTLESLRAQISLVLQSDLAFNDSVLANIALGDPSFTLPRVIEAAKIAHVHHVIQDLPDGYETRIGSLGHYLKPDELYRIALARAILQDPSILIVEEPDVPLTDDVKHLIDDTIDRISQNRTVIFLPRRLTTLRNCQHVLVLHNGRIEAAGSPRDLQIQSKLYRQIQASEFNPVSANEPDAAEMVG
jgi:ABC-type multidrug transport system fused ATPase/permease subunit